MAYPSALLKGKEYLAKATALTALCLIPAAASWAQSAAYTLQVMRSSHGHVASVSQPGPVFSGQIACGPQFNRCHTTFHPDTNVILTATPAQGFRFDGWGTPQGGSDVNTQNCEYTVDNECYVTMRGETTVVALFSPVTSTGGTCQAREFSEAEETMLDAYIAYYGRPPDVPGLAAWVGQLARTDLHRNSVLSMFGRSEEYQNRFGRLTSSQLINNLYLQIFGRDADPAGLNYWTVLLDSGAELTTIAMEILSGARNDDAVVLENRRKVARHFVTVSAGKNIRASEIDTANLLSLVKGERKTRKIPLRDASGNILKDENDETMYQKDELGDDIEEAYMDIAHISSQANAICNTYTDLLR